MKPAEQKKFEVSGTKWMETKGVEGKEMKAGMGGITKLKSQNGVSFLMALIFLLVCALAGSSILVMAQSYGKRSFAEHEEDAKKFAVMSAYDVLKEQFSRCSEIWNTDSLEECGENELCIEILEEIHSLARNCLINPGKAVQRSRFRFLVEDEIDGAWKMPEVQAQITISPDEEETVEFLDDENKVILIPIKITVVFYVADGESRESYMSLCIYGSVVYDEEALTMEISLDEPSVKGE